MKVCIAMMAASLLLPSVPTFAANFDIKCPHRVEVAETLKASYPSWEVTADKGKGDVNLQSMLLFDGHPRELASLAPDQSTEAKGQLIATWQLPKPEADRAYWVACAYRNSMTMLVKRLPDTVMSCRYVQKRLASGTLAGVESFICK
jgi:hypothetical protein